MISLCVLLVAFAPAVRSADRHSSESTSLEVSSPAEEAVDYDLEPGSNDAVTMDKPTLSMLDVKSSLSKTQVLDMKGVDSVNGDSLGQTSTLGEFWRKICISPAESAFQIMPSGFSDSVVVSGFAAPDLALQSSLETFERSLHSSLRNVKMAQECGRAIDVQGLEESVVALLRHFGPGPLQFGVAKRRGVNWHTLSLTSGDGTLNSDKPCHGGCQLTEAFRFTEKSPLGRLLQPLLPALARVRLSSLFPGEVINYHVDGALTCRCHVVLTRNADAHTMLGMQPMPSTHGSAYCGDFDFPHTVWNLGENVRTHLWFDVMIGRGQEALQNSTVGNDILQACQAIQKQPGLKEAKQIAHGLLKHYKDNFSDPGGLARAKLEKSLAAKRNTQVSEHFSRQEQRQSMLDVKSSVGN